MKFKVISSFSACEILLSRTDLKCYLTLLIALRLISGLAIGLILFHVLVVKMESEYT